MLPVGWLLSSGADGIVHNELLSLANVPNVLFEGYRFRTHLPMHTASTSRTMTPQSSAIVVLALSSSKPRTKLSLLAREAHVLGCRAASSIGHSRRQWL